MKEIFKLKEMLEKENIPFDFIKREEVEGYQIAYPVFSIDANRCICSVIQHKFSYGNDYNLLEIMGLIRTEYDTVEGYLSAEDVFERIKKHYEASYKQVKDGEI